MSTTPEEVLLPKSTARFRCIGGACEDHCCHGWDITVDRGNYKKVQEAMGDTGEDRERFGRFYKRNRFSQGDCDFAHITLKKEDGSCPFVEESGLCELHRRFGEECLSGTCRTYPKRISQVGDGIEVSASLSCPEVARLCLLDPEGSSLSLCSSEDYPVQGLRLVAQLPPSDDPYLQYVNEIREIVLELLSMRQYPMTSRLFTLSYFADRLSPFFFKGGRGFSDEQLEVEMDHLAAEGVLPELHRGYTSLSFPIELPMRLIRTVLATRTPGRSFAGLFQRIWDFHGVDNRKTIPSATGDDNEGEDGDIQRMLALYRDRSGKLYKRFSVRIDQYFENYCKNNWFGYLYTDSSNLHAHTQNMLIRLGMISFLFYSHPDLEDLTDQASEVDPAEEKLLDRVAVEVFYKFSRAVEHSQKLQEGLDGFMEKNGKQTLEHSIELVKFIEGA